ncbi:aquaporin-like protein [Jaminaea rosea]|uniref:Aquaporin-like protein n=1 Tax=Jaminaea rosea TaxID=1569628 RepID=A0A316UL06_9BASI|nr:aquaporin-like protein [Jaminaea rosea]PWN25937.1 aquaporin-like protein [Jaminaea rosea]
MDPETGADSAPPSSPPTVFQRFKANWGDYVAEAIGAGTIVLFGSGASLQLQLYGAGDVLTAHLGWAIGVGLGAYVAGPISGGHINPAVTIAQAVFRRFPLRKVPGYLLAQTLGCFIAAWIIYTNYSEAIDHFEPNGGRAVFGTNATAGNFISIPAPGISLWSAFHDEFLGTALLVGGIFAFTNPALPGHALAFAIFFLLLAIANGVGAQTGAAINPARDFGPRLALATLGYPIKDLFGHNSGYWLHGIWAANILGGLVGAGLVDLLLYTGADSIFNRPPELP